MAAAKVPTLLKHNTLAIWRKGDVDGGSVRERFVSAWNIARSRLVEYGYLIKGSEKSKAEDIRMTTKGAVRNRKHSREPDSKAKSNLFDKMYPWINLAETAAGAQGKPLKSVRAVDGVNRGALAKAKADTAVVTPQLNAPKKPGSGSRKALPSRKLEPKSKPPSPFDRKRPK
jgi:hypothetical protein